MKLAHYFPKMPVYRQPKRKAPRISGHYKGWSALYTEYGLESKIDECIRSRL